MLFATVYAMGRHVTEDRAVSILLTAVTLAGQGGNLMNEPVPVGTGRILLYKWSQRTLPSLTLSGMSLQEICPGCVEESPRQGYRPYSQVLA